MLRLLLCSASQHTSKQIIGTPFLQFLTCSILTCSQTLCWGPVCSRHALMRRPGSVHGLRVQGPSPLLMSMIQTGSLNNSHLRRPLGGVCSLEGSDRRELTLLDILARRPEHQIGCPLDRLVRGRTMFGCVQYVSSRCECADKQLGLCWTFTCLRYLAYFVCSK